MVFIMCETNKISLDNDSLYKGEEVKKRLDKHGFINYTLSKPKREGKYLRGDSGGDVKEVVGWSFK